MQFFWQRLESLSLRLTPPAITALMVLCCAVPVRIAGLHSIMPQLTFISIYYWGLFLPRSLPYVFLFALGLLEDTLAGTPLGLSSFGNVLFAYLLSAQRRIFSQNLFVTMWMGFCLLLAVTLTVQWLIMSIYQGRLMAGDMLALRFAASVLAYPLIHQILTFLYRKMVSTR